MNPWIDAKKSGELEILLSTKTNKFLASVAQRLCVCVCVCGFFLAKFRHFFDKEIGKSFGLFFFGVRFSSVNSTYFSSFSMQENKIS
jgi:hypothetical protein